MTADRVDRIPEPKECSAEWLEQQPPEFRWAAAEVLAMYGDRVGNPSYDVALYHLRYAVAEVKRLRAELAAVRAERDEARESTLREAANHFDRMADFEPDGYRARVMRGAANDIRRLIPAEAGESR